MLLLNLHHVGIVVADIAGTSKDYAIRLGCQIRSPIIHDPAQTAYVQFLSQPGDSVFLELVSPDGPESKLASALSKDGGLNHLCYAVNDIDSACRQLRSRGMYLIQPPVPAAAFPARRIAWLIGRERIPTELVERGSDGEL
jgi:methylmalonyl-CoA/ethylmalonyl-CoA epimerase